MGVIASNGLKVLIEEQIDFNHVRNLIIASSMLVLGLGRRGSGYRRRGYLVRYSIERYYRYCVELGSAA